MSQYFPRTELAAQMAGQLLHPGVLDEGLRSGLFIAGQRRSAPDRQNHLSATRPDSSAGTTGRARDLCRLVERPQGQYQSKRDVVLVVDEVQQAITTDEGNELLLALKDHVLARLRESGAAPMPSREAAINAFQALGHRPEELLRALRQLQTADAPTDTALAIIAMTLRSTAADVELAKLEQLGALATAVFVRIAATTGEATGVFSGVGAVAYTMAVGREVKIEHIQPVVNELMAANLIMRRSHGHYAIAAPFVQQAWQEKQSLLRIDGSVS
ncbi:hypothetical protein [Duganella sp. BuS-21]|uniref:hypothetical protein n=1 Tax=Duganella sp. BuS-21 TaxID=2943848 RepID=UPI0035A60F4E